MHANLTTSLSGRKSAMCWWIYSSDKVSSDSIDQSLFSTLKVMNLGVTEDFGKVRYLFVFMFCDLMGHVIMAFNVCVPSGAK